MLSRRTLVQGGMVGLLQPLAFDGTHAMAETRAPTLLTGPIEMVGDWGHMIPESVHKVLERARHACLDGTRLLSDSQPESLRVEARSLGPPAIWLHTDVPKTGWIQVDIDERDWARLAYQFGHELGHVTANSWRRDAKPLSPCQWLEEAMVEAFSLRGLARLADAWSRDPPFVGDSGFGGAIAAYRQDALDRYAKLAAGQGHVTDFGAWFEAHRTDIETRAFLSDFAKAASLTLLAEYERDPLGLKRWGRSIVGSAAAR
jgi:hypothetical protein